MPFLSLQPPPHTKEKPGSHYNHSFKKVLKLDEKEATNLLRKHAASKEAFDKVLAHSKAVQKIALRIAEKVRGVDRDFISIASLLHDIGRFDYPPGKGTIMHGVRGAQILREEGIDDRYALVCERHLGAGITKEEIRRQKLPLPVKDYVPLTLEEKIITYADLLLKGEKEVPFEEMLDKYRKELGEDVAKQLIWLHDEIKRMQDGP